MLLPVSNIVFASSGWTSKDFLIDTLDVMTAVLLDDEGGHFFQT